MEDRIESDVEVEVDVALTIEDMVSSYLQQEARKKKQEASSKREE